MERSTNAKLYCAPQFYLLLSIQGILNVKEVLYFSDQLFIACSSLVLPGQPHIIDALPWKDVT